MIYNNFTIYNNSSENSSRAIVPKAKEKTVSGIGTVIIVYCKVVKNHIVLRPYKH